MAFKNKKYVYRSTVESREKQIPSLLAIAEVIFAVSLYWGIAIYFDTYFYIIPSLFIAPLLLLRSRKSKSEGIKWFLTDFFNFDDYQNWPNYKKVGWLSLLTIVIFILVGLISFWLSDNWLSDKKGIFLYLYAAGIGIICPLLGMIISIIFSISVSYSELIYDKSKIAIVESLRFGFLIGLLASLIAIAVAAKISVAVSVATGGVMTFVVFLAIIYMIAIRGNVISVRKNSFLKSKIVVNKLELTNEKGALGTKSGLAFLAIILLGVGIGITIRAVFFRIISIMKHPVTGLKSLPLNWRENIIVIDSFTAPELMPDLNKSTDSISLSNFISKYQNRDIWFPKTFYLIVGLMWFGPAIFYRLSMKATSWFYWPLAFLLHPTKDTNHNESERDLCWLWRNPMQLVLNLFVIFGAIILTIASIDPSLIKSFSTQDAIPAWMEYIMILDWSSLAPWDIANLVIASCVFAMMWLSGDAINSYKAGVKYHQKNPWALQLMNFLWRVRMLAVIAALVFGLGNLVLLYEPNWLNYLPLGFNEVIKEFYYQQ